MGKDWDEDLDLLMYALCSVHNESTNISAFELIFGRRPRTILTSIKERILQGVRKGEEFDASKYLASLNQRLSKLLQFAQSNLQIAQEGMKHLYDKKAKIRSFNVGDEVLVHHPIPGNSLREKFMGLYVIAKRISKVNYLIKTPDKIKSSRVVHINLLKPYVRLPSKEVCNLAAVHSEPLMESDNNSVAEKSLSDKIVMS
ncbi:uncharacterized protein [Palaemon carinicauda]|uniref:uncharacterized protein n=1 Tax=Palaemon carinicauda TaxID=392227 RepID=UPI0035B629EB